MFLRTDPFFADFDRWLAPRAVGRADAPSSLAADATRFDDRVELRFDLPGVPPSDIELTVDKGTLRLSVERPAVELEGATATRAERWHGTRSRSFRLGERLDADQLTTSYEHGVLLVSIPVLAEDQPRRIEIGDPGPAELAA